VYITDLFKEGFLHTQVERGLYSLDGGNSFTPFLSVGGFNGALTLTINNNASSILFKSSNDGFSDYSVKGLTYQAQSIPEPTTLLLLGAGFAGVAGLRWRRGRA
jgi:hypothetical protein